MSTAVLPTSRPAGPAAEPSSGRVARTTTRLVRRWAPSAGEGVLALALTVVLTALAARIHGNPLHKAAQVSALSRMQLLVSGTAVVVVGVLGRYAVRGSGRRWDLLLRLGAAAVVGVTGGFLGGAEAWALHGTPWPINGETGDNGRMIRWAQQVQAHGTFDNIYPPGMPHIGAFVAEHFTHGNVPEAFKPIYIFCLAFTPVLVFLFWRMLVAPLPAAAIAVLGALTSPMATKPYSPLVAMLLVPVVAKLAQWLRSSPGVTPARAALRGLWLGLLCGGLFLVYSGWHVFTFPAIAALLLALFPWRSGWAGRLRGLALAASFGAGFLALAAGYLWQMLGATGTRDLLCNSYTLADPASTTVSLTLVADPWPVLLLGAGLAVWLGLRRSTVLAVLFCTAGVWLMRFYLASRMAADQNVRLFPHTAIELRYLFIVLLVLGLALGAGTLARALAVSGTAFARQGAVAVLLALFVVAGVGGSAAAQGILPTAPSLRQSGTATWDAHQLRDQDTGHCPRYAVGGTCRTMPALAPDDGTVTQTGPLPCPAFGFKDGRRLDAPPR
ncbi:hypothetical protein [Streptacidiphilus monticola]|uniref:Galactan 5-O-arabinofuranosyltransferase n=1 Tax=Streptacidiphilus monticola TaxID=2161674 RepID=A0ABW1G0G5_9ACTN